MAPDDNGNGSESGLKDNGAAHTGDTLPDDLKVESAYVGPYQFPDVRRRRLAAALYLIVAAIAIAAGVTSSNAVLAAGGVVVALIALYHLLCAYPLAVDQTEALATASRAVGFPVGHASAQVTWRGLRSKPMWRVLVYSADDPPSLRGIVELDAVDGHVLFSTSEQNPEDWSQFGITTPPPPDE
jgi:hypothetical protein